MKMGTYIIKRDSLIASIFIWWYSSIHHPPSPQSHVSSNSKTFRSSASASQVLNSPPQSQSEYELQCIMGNLSRYDLILASWLEQSFSRSQTLRDHQGSWESCNVGQHHDKPDIRNGRSQSRMDKTTPWLICFALFRQKYRPSSTKTLPRAHNVVMSSEVS
jgi:hypothetical protein